MKGEFSWKEDCKETLKPENLEKRIVERVAILLGAGLVTHNAALVFPSLGFYIGGYAVLVLLPRDFPPYSPIKRQ